MAAFSTVPWAIIATAGQSWKWASWKPFERLSCRRISSSSAEVFMHDSGDNGKKSSKLGAWVSLGKLVRKAIDDASDAKRAYHALRVLYGKKEYRSVWPSNIIRID